MNAYSHSFLLSSTCSRSFSTFSNTQACAGGYQWTFGVFTACSVTVSRHTSHIRPHCNHIMSSHLRTRSFNVLFAFLFSLLFSSSAVAALKLARPCVHRTESSSQIQPQRAQERRERQSHHKHGTRTANTEKKRHEGISRCSFFLLLLLCFSLFLTLVVCVDFLNLFVIISRVSFICYLAYVCFVYSHLFVISTFSSFFVPFLFIIFFEIFNFLFYVLFSCVLHL